MKFLSHEVVLDLEKLTWFLVFIIDDTGALVASCELSQWDTDTPFLSKVFVHPTHRNKGYGRTLVEAVIHECSLRGKHSISMWVHPENELAIKLYRKLGFDRCFTDTTDGKHFMSLVLKRAANP